MSNTTIVEKTSPPDTPAEEKVREVLERLRREPDAPSGWVMRKQRTSPLETRYVTR